MDDPYWLSGCGQCHQYPNQTNQQAYGQQLRCYQCGRQKQEQSTRICPSNESGSLYCCFNYHEGSNRMDQSSGNKCQCLSRQGANPAPAHSSWTMTIESQQGQPNAPTDISLLPRQLAPPQQPMFGEYILPSAHSASFQPSNNSRNGQQYLGGAFFSQPPPTTPPFHFQQRQQAFDSNTNNNDYSKQLEVPLNQVEADEANKELAASIAVPEASSQTAPPLNSDDNGPPVNQVVSKAVSKPDGAIEPQASTSNAPYNNCIIGGEELREVLLFGRRIWALIRNQEEWLCSEQIAKTLLSEFSKKVIRNHKSSLKIMGIRCTPKQVRLLHSIGAVPSIIHRYGLISRPDAERLCRSLLIRDKPEFPETLSLPVVHRICWGCKGRCVPVLYKSRQSKCVECGQCGQFFTPAMFVHHSHRLPTMTREDYRPIKTVRINQWRKVLELDYSLLEGPKEEKEKAWKDVKYLFEDLVAKRRRRATADLVCYIIDKTNEIQKALIDQEK